jgi:hypothetical protein
MRLRNEICLRRRANQNLGAEERRVLEHVKKRGDVRMSVLDKNVGICVYSISKQNEAVRKHLVSSNFRKVEGIIPKKTGTSQTQRLLEHTACVQGSDSKGS